jgi:hypothetical protein
LLLLDPAANPERTPNKRPVRRIKLFRQGELGRMMLDAPTDADRELSMAEIVTALLVAGRHGRAQGARLRAGCGGT